MSILSLVGSRLCTQQHSFRPITNRSRQASRVTEFGYSTAYLDTNYGASQLVQAKNTFNGLLDAFKAGVPHTYIYQLNDEGPNPSASDVGNSWGLFNYDGTMKRAATAIHNFTSVVSDTGAAAKSFAPGQIGFSINNLPTSGKSFFSGKVERSLRSCGVERTCRLDSSSHSDVTVSPTTATVSLDATYASIKVFDPIVGTAPIATYTNASSVQLGLTDHPLIVELSAGGANQPPLPPPPAPSPDGTKISSAAANPIIDQAGNAWKLVQSASNGLQIAVNGTVDPATANVVLLEILGGKIVRRTPPPTGIRNPAPVALGPRSRRQSRRRPSLLRSRRRPPRRARTARRSAPPRRTRS